MLLQDSRDTKSPATCDAFGNGVRKEVPVKAVGVPVLIKNSLKHRLERLLEELLDEGFAFGEEPVVLVEDSRVELRVGDHRSDATSIEVDYEGLLSDMQPGDRVSLGDGRVILEVRDVSEESL